IALIAAVWALLLLKPDLDDALYVNFAVAAADSPASPLLAGDTLYGIAGLPIAFPAYRVHSYEIWNGALSYLTGIPAIVCFHWISAAVVAALVPLAYARLFRLLLPGQWLAATALSVLLLAAVGGTHEWNASFAFARIWQGKSVFVAAVLPLVYAYAIEFAVAPSPRRWLMLGASQVAAIGCTSTALWTAPFAAVAALASTVRPTARGVAVLGAGALASGYVLAAAAVLKPAMSATSAASAPAVAEGTLGGVLSGVFGGGALRLFVLGAVVAAWAFSPRGPATRFAVGVPLAALLGPWNPWAERWVAANLTGWPYWRIAWAMPVPILMTLVLAAPLRRNVLSVRGWLACLAVVAVLAAKRPVPVPVRWPALKVPRKAYAWAATLTRRAPPGAHVVAPGEVANWLTTFHGRVYPLDVRSSLYLAAGFIAPEEIRTRRWMIRFASGGDPSAGAVRRFRGGLDRFDVRGVCLRRRRGTPEVETALRDAGFRRTDRDARYEVWTR
nr:hypothetical protein [Candidatus Binatota bacterium]